MVAGSKKSKAAFHGHETEGSVSVISSALISAPSTVPDGFGDKVAFNHDGSLVVVEAEWNDGVDSAVFLARRITGVEYTAWKKLGSNMDKKAQVRNLKPRGPREYGTSVQRITLASLYTESYDSYSLTDEISVDVTIDPEALEKAKALYERLQVDTTRGLISADASVIVISTQLLVNNASEPNKTNAADQSEIPGTMFGGNPGSGFVSKSGVTPAQYKPFTTTYKDSYSGYSAPELTKDISSSLSGQIYVFKRSSEGITLQQTIFSPLGQQLGGKFGKDIAMDELGLNLAVSEILIGGFYVYSRYSTDDEFTLVSKIKVFPSAVNTSAEIEELAFTPDGSYLVAGWKQPANKSNSKLSETGSFAIFSANDSLAATSGSRLALRSSLSSSILFRGYQMVTSVNTHVPNLDGMRVAFIGGSVVRVLLGFSGEMAQVYDIEVGPSVRPFRPPPGPCLVIKPRYNEQDLNNTSDVNNINTVFEAVAISRDGLTIGLGAEGTNALLIAIIDPPSV